MLNIQVKSKDNKLVSRGYVNLPRDYMLDPLATLITL